MINITIDDIVFEVWGDRVLWSPPSTDGAFVEAPSDWARMARAFVLCDYEDRDGRTYIAGSLLHEHFVDTHDSEGRPVPGGRPSGLHFALKSGMPPFRAKRVMTGKIMPQGVLIVSVLEWDDPLDAVMGTAEAEEVFGLAVGTVKKACQLGFPHRKSGKINLMRRVDVQKRWG